MTIAVLGSATALGQAREGCCGQSYPAAEYQVANAENSVAFYHDVLGLEYPPGWTGKINAASQAQSQLTGAVNGLIRVVALPIPGASWHMQIVDTTGIDRKPVAPRRQDIGAPGLILYVRNLDASAAALKKTGAPIVTIGGAPVPIGGNNSKSRAILAKDPDGFFIELRQMDPLPQTSAPATSNVIGARVAVSIGDTGQTTRYWRDLLDFDVDSDAAFSKDSVELALQGAPGAQVRKSIATLRTNGKFAHPDVVFEFLEFKNIERRVLVPRYQDPGSGAFVLRLRTGNSGIRGKEMADLVKLLKASPQAKILTAGGDALDQGRRLAMFTQDLNGFILEATQSTGDATESSGGQPRK